MDRNAQNGVHQRRSAIVRRAKATPTVEFFNVLTSPALLETTESVLPEHQAVYPQPSTQAPGVGFPLARLVMVICLATGAALDMVVGPHSGKGSGELGLVRSLLKSFCPGDVMLADALYCNYFLIATLMRAGVDVLFEQNGSRITDLSTWPVAGRRVTIPCAGANLRHAHSG